MTAQGALTLDLDVGAAAPSGVERLVADVFLPDPSGLREAPVVMVCVPGGGMSRRYFDLRVPDELGCYSMARHLAAAGNVVVTIDPPGVGDSDHPIDGYSLTPAVVADVVACATSSILDRLRIGAVSDEFPACSDLVPCGLGHSAGGLLTVVQQARHHSYRALVLLGFEGGGLVDILTDDERRYLDDPDGLSEVIASLAAARFNDPLPVGTSATSSFLIRGDPPAPVKAAIADAGSALLAVVGLACLVRGSVSKELSSIDVPVFLGTGEFDITGFPHAIPRQFPGSQDVTVFVLPNAGHNHNVAGSRVVLWDRIAGWAESLAAVSSGELRAPTVEARRRATSAAADHDV